MIFQAIDSMILHLHIHHLHKAQFLYFKGINVDSLQYVYLMEPKMKELTRTTRESVQS